jgi:Fe2+ transport system protein B
MAGDDHRSASERIEDRIEDVLLRRLRAIAVIVILLMIVFYSVGDVIGRLFIDPAFHISDVALGTLIGALLILLGLESVTRLPKR